MLWVIEHLGDNKYRFIIMNKISRNIHTYFMHLCSYVEIKERLRNVVLTENYLETMTQVKIAAGYNTINSKVTLNA